MREFELLGVPLAERARRTEELVTTARRVWADGTVTPPPFQQPEPPFWIGGSGAAAARRAARLGCSFMPDAFVPTEVVELYRSLGGTRVSINPSVYVGDWDDVAPHFLYQYNLYREWGGGEQLASADELPRDRYLIGEPETVAAGVRAPDRTHRRRAALLLGSPARAADRARQPVDRTLREGGDSACRGCRSGLRSTRARG